jgi:signal transduction histidine kinase/ActR/RegA family two-component response regulator
MKHRSSDLERRLLVLAPIGKDGALIQSALGRNVMNCECYLCATFDVLVRELSRGAVALLISEEALADADDRLAAHIARQPPWSDLPVLVLTGQGADSVNVTRAVQTLGNVTLLERPIRVAALVSAVRSAIRARLRQYETRIHLQDRDTENRRKDEFIATLAHELRNPLAPIRNAVHLLRHSNVEPQIRDMLERQVGHIVRLVDDLLEVSRITHGKIELRKERVDVTRIIDAALETTKPLIEAAKLQLEVRQAGAPAFIDADVTRLSQVFSNLLNNAAKYTDAGGRVSLAVRCDAESVYVAITDTGVGIASQTLPHVFDMFMQAEAVGGRTRSGLGIGLTLARKLVEMHGGRLTAHSEGVGKGSTFVVHLPLSARTEQDVTTGTHPTSEVATGSVTQRVLVVDDNRDAADSLGTLLQLQGAEVRVVYDGHAALGVLREFRPTVIFLDLGMPGLDGFEVARRIRQREDFRGIALVAVTGWGQEQDRRRTRAAGFDRHLVKPIDPGNMHSVLASLARRSASGIERDSARHSPHS